MNRRLTITAISLLVFGIVMRILPHPANLAPVGAIALYGGMILPRRVSWWLPVAIMAIADIYLGTYPGIIFTWSAYIMVSLYAMSIRNHHNWLRLPLGVIGSSVIFFVISNLGVWVQGNLYTHTWSGFIACYTMALPFFRNTFLGDAMYSAILFGAYAVARHSITTHSSVQELGQQSTP